MAQRLRGGAQKRERIDAGMAREAVILVSAQHVQIGGVHPARADRQPPTPIRDRMDMQERSTPVRHLDRCLPPERGHAGGVDPAIKPVAQPRRKHQRQRKPDEAPPPHGVTVMRPEAVVARRAGRYMSSTSAAGW